MTVEGVTFVGAGPQEPREEADGAMRNSETISLAPRWFACLGCLLVLALAGCGNADRPNAATSSYNAKFRKAHPVKAPVVPGQEDPADMVAAVSSARTAPVELKFSLTTRPQVGQPTELWVALIPAAGLDSVSAVLQASDGLDITDGAQIAKVLKPAAGAPVRQMLRLVPKRNGIFAVTAVVSVESGNQTSTRSFSIPLIAGGGVGEAAQPPVAAKGS